MHFGLVRPHTIDYSLIQIGDSYLPSLASKGCVIIQSTGENLSGSSTCLFAIWCNYGCFKLYRFFFGEVVFGELHLKVIWE